MKDVIDLSVSGFPKKLLRDNVIVKLPEGTGNHFNHKSGLVISTTLSDDSLYYPVFGDVVLIAPDTKKVEIGDKVFFPYLSTYNAYNRPKRDGTVNYGNTKTIFTFNEEQYMIIPESELILAKRGEEIVSLNEWVLLKHIPKKNVQRLEVEGLNGQKWKVNTTITESQILLLEKGEHFEETLAEVVAAPDDMELSEGDTVAVVKHWDVNLESELMETIGFPLFYINRECVMKYEKTSTPTSSPKKYPTFAAQS